MLENGFWNEYIGKDKVFIFKFKNGEIKIMKKKYYTYVVNLQIANLSLLIKC